MACYRVVLYEPDSQPVYAWLRETFPPGSLVRTLGYDLSELENKPWFVIKIIFKKKEDADACHRRWLPNEPIHDVKPWGQR